MSLNWPILMSTVLEQYQLPWYGPHGLAHWARVRENGLRLADSTGANPRVVELFAVFHDACRRSEGHDPRHGKRGAQLAKKLRKKHLDLDDDEFKQLFVACAEHTHGKRKAAITVQTCWDADRLDLGRVWITPDPKRLCTAAARETSMIEWALARSRRDHVPSVIHECWVTPDRGSRES